MGVRSLSVEQIPLIRQSLALSRRIGSTSNSIYYTRLNETEVLLNPDIFKEIANFYNRNWTGNKDFMHIPSLEDVESNYVKGFHTILSRDYKTGELIGIATVKHDRNSYQKIDPYYPYENRGFYSITGVLTKYHSRYRGLGVGKKIYELAIRNYVDEKRVNPNNSMMIEIDCRNRNSMNAIFVAAENVSDVVPAITGIYTLTDESGNMVEAPTFIVELVNPSLMVQHINEERPVLNYENPSNHSELFQSLFNQMIQSFPIDRVITNPDGDNYVNFYPVQPQLLPIINPGETAKGNNRQPTEMLPIGSDCPKRKVYQRRNVLKFGGVASE